MKILVTGGAGFIGSHTIDCLINRGHSVRVLDALVSQVHGNDRRKPIHLDDRVELIVGRIDDPAIGLLAQIVHGADVAEDLYGRPEAPGLKAVAEGFQAMGLPDHEVLRLQFPLYDALYEYCRRRTSA